MSPLVKQCIGTRDERCTEHVPVGQARCAKHEREHRRRDSARRRQKPSWNVYQSSAWRGPNGVRNQALHRDDHTCQHCGRPATSVHHIVAIANCEAADVDIYDLDNLVSLCTSCSGRADAARSHKTTRDDDRPAWIG